MQIQGIEVSVPLNPIAEHQLPSTANMVLDQPLIVPPKVMRRLTFAQTLYLIGFASLALLLVSPAGVYGEARLFEAHKSFLLGWFIFCFSSRRYLCLTSVIVPPVAFFLTQFLSVHFQLVLAFGLLCLLSGVFTLHQIHLATAAPNTLSRRKEDRAKGHELAVLSSLLLLGPPLISQFVSNNVVALLRLVTIVVILVQSFYCLIHIGALREAWKSWCSYNGEDRTLPGIMESPGGQRPVRVIFTCLVLAVTTSAFLHVAYKPVSPVLLTEYSSSMELQPLDPETNETMIAIGKAAYLWPVVTFSALGALYVLPALFVIGSCVLTAAPLAGFWKRLQAEKAKHPEFSHELALALRESENATERNSLLLGTILSDNMPVLSPRAFFDNHAYLRGDPGSGKTAALCSVIEQLLSFENATVHIFDLKGHTPELFEAAKAGAARSRVPVRTQWFIDRIGHSTHVFNLFEQPFWAELTPSQKAGLLCAATGTDYGGTVEYGPGWYGDANYENLVHIFERSAEINSFRAIIDRSLSDPHKKDLGGEVKRAGEHIRIACKRLARVAGLNAPNSIDLTAGFDSPQVVYWSLSGSTGYKTSSDICRLVLASIITAAGLRREKPIQVYCVIDEFQRVLGKNLEYILETARSLGVSLILANQTIEAINTRDVDLRPIVRTCCRVQWTFAISDPNEQLEMARASGEAIARLRTDTTTKTRSVIGQAMSTTLTESVSYAEHIRPLLPINEIKRASSEKGTSILLLTQNEGFAQFNGLPVVLQTPFHITPAEYELRKNAPWPESEFGTIVPQLIEPPTTPEPVPTSVLGTDTFAAPPRTAKRNPRPEHHRETPPRRDGSKE